MAAKQADDFLIMSPAMIADNNLFEAVYALYFLPEHFKLIVTGGKHVAPSFYKKVGILIDRIGVGHRVQFTDSATNVHAVIGAKTDNAKSGLVTGDSAEALASAVLNVARG